MQRRKLFQKETTTSINHGGDGAVFPLKPKCRVGEGTGRNQASLDGPSTAFLETQSLFSQRRVIFLRGEVETQMILSSELLRHSLIWDKRM